MWERRVQQIVYRIFLTLADWNTEGMNRGFEVTLTDVMFLSPKYLGSHVVKVDDEVSHIPRFYDQRWYQSHPSHLIGG
jgi:hypothetical protein